MPSYEKTLPITAFQGLLEEMCAAAAAELLATRARLEALDAERDPPG
ncbi:MAG: hypothetical protein HYS27_21040 [Deltaproteobacteria bacterium]|nr:hypothetical protein [Deltaproteobacteria bacterium]